MRSDRPAGKEVGIRLARRGAVAGLAVATLGIGFWLGGTGGPQPQPQPQAPAAPPAAPPSQQTTQPEGPHALVLPIDKAARLIALGGVEACALGGTRITCTTDAGSTWDDPVDLPEAPLAVIRFGATRLAAAVDGAIYELRKDAPPQPWAAPPNDLAVVDATAENGALWLLAHRYDEPEDDLLRLPRVLETVVLRIGESGTLERRGSLKGYGGERILVEATGSVVTWAPFDLRAWRSKDEGRTFRRISAAQRFGADFGGLQVAVERKAERLPGPGRKARPASALLVSTDGAAWETVLETPGELLVDFADAKKGVVISRGEGLAQLTTDGGQSFAPLWRDGRLDDAVALAHVGDRFLAITGEGLLFVLPLP